MSEAINYQSDGGDRLQWVDSLRGIAVLGVVLVHCGQAARSTGSLGDFAAAGQYGVQLFFIISAITISLTYSKHIAKNGSSFRSNLAWISKRLFRIAPLYYLAAVFYSAEHFVLNSKLGDLVSNKPDLFDFVMNILLVHTWVPSAVNSIVPGGWSIGVEVMFYCMFPLIMHASGVRRFPLILASAAALILTLSEIAGRSLSNSFPTISDQYFYLWFPAQVPVLLIGCAFYHHFITRGTVDIRPNTLIILVFFSCLPGWG